MQKIDLPLKFAMAGVLAIVAATLLSPLVGPSLALGKSNAHSAEIVDWWWNSEVWTAIFTGILTLSTIGLWLQTKRLAKGAEIQSDDTKKSITIAQKAADAALAANRAWIKVEATLTGAMTIGDVGLRLPIMVTLSNVGSTPAVSVNFVTLSTIYFFDPDFPQNIRKLKSQKPLNTPTQEIGSVLFPGKSQSIGDVFMIEKQAIDAHLSQGRRSSRMGFAIISHYSFAGGEGTTVITFALNRYPISSESGLDLTRKVTPPDEIFLQEMPVFCAAS